ncbi:MAG TPA: hypothetical protein DCG24_01695 [Bacteroidetes bacterium]|nr:hypothetical protein [Chitinophagales bacterium]HAE12910.1 hypothetical protein [Bacteroidota bacterium]
MSGTRTSNLKMFVSGSFIMWLILICMMAANTAVAQVEDSTETALGIRPAEEPSPLRKISVSGFYRFFATYTTHDLPYVLNPVINDTVLPASLFIGDDSQLPNLQLTISGKPAPHTSFSFDVFAFQFLNGAIGTTYGAQVPDSLRPSFQDPLSGTRLGGQMNLNLGLNFTGIQETRSGTFTLRAGGIHWVRLSDLTMASFRGYNRFTLFERNPWDPAGASLPARYETYFNEGGINQDTRWGNRAFKGLILDGNGLPKDLSFTALVGKSEFNGGFSPWPSYTYGGKLQKKTGPGQYISINSLHATTWADSLSEEKVGFHLTTLEWMVHMKGFSLLAEGGLGNYFSPVQDAGNGGLISATLTTPAKKTLPRWSLHYFYISPKVINNNSIFLNTAIREYNPAALPAGTIGSTAVLQPFGSSMLRIGQMSNNRQGADLNMEYTLGDFKFNIGLAAQAELEPISSVITYGHPVNQLTRSRMWRWLFPAEVGPYQRYSVIYRDVYETVNLFDDSSGVVINKKFFSVFEPQVKYHSKVFGKNIYLFYLGYYSSVQRSFSAFTVTSEEAYIRQYANELEAYLELGDRILISGYAGYERTLGNYLTDIDEESRRPRNQTGTGYGAGLDIDLGFNARLYLRHRWFAFEDASFADDAFQGQETMVEIKIFF